MAPPERMHKFSITLDTKSRDLLDAATDRYGISRADLIRFAVREVFAPLGRDGNTIEQAIDRLRGVEMRGGRE